MTHGARGYRTARTSTVVKACLVSVAVFIFLSISLSLNGSFSIRYGNRAQALQNNSQPTQSYLSRVSAQQPQVNGKVISGKGVVIGIYDGGVNLENSAVKNSNGTSKIISQSCFGNSSEVNLCDNSAGHQAQNLCFTNDVGCFHGMAVAGFAAGNKQIVNLRGEKVEVGGVAPSAQITYIRQAMDKAGTIKYNDFISALGTYVQMVRTNSPFAPDVINLSLSFPRSGYPNCEQDNQIKRDIDYLVNSGVIVVAATGNDSNKEAITYPACMKNVIAVGSSGLSTDSNGNSVDVVSRFSNMSNDVTLVAPGEQQWGLLPKESEFVKVSGTSFAAPIVSGAAALLKELKPSISQAQVADIFNRTGDVVVDPASGKSFRKLNVERAIALLSPSTTNKDNESVPAEKVVVSDDLSPVSPSINEVQESRSNIDLSNLDPYRSNAGTSAPSHRLEIYLIIGGISLLALATLIHNKLRSRRSSPTFSFEHFGFDQPVEREIDLSLIELEEDEFRQILVND